MASTVLPVSRYEPWAADPRRGWWGNEKEEKVDLSETQRPGPEDLKAGIDGWPRQGQRAEGGLLAAGYPLRHSLQHEVQKREGGPRRIQVVEPAAHSGGVGNAIGIFERRRCVFPRALLHKTPPQRLTTRDQTVMGVRQGEGWQETKNYAAQRTDAAAVPDPIVTLIMGLLASPAMADDRIEQAKRTPAKNHSCTGRPVKSGLAMVGKKWDNVDRTVARLSH